MARSALSSTQPIIPKARIISVVPDSPAYDAGFEPGCFVTSVDGQPLRDMIDWRWLASEDEIELGYIDLDGESGTVVLEREPGEDWGFEFDGAVFDDVKMCRNACTFCFMRQLPEGMRPSLSLRDDDFRLSFLEGTFVTLTNLTDADERRISEQHISPLRVSLHATDPEVRRKLIGRHAQHGLDSLERLLGEGIEFDAQIVLVPGVNDGDVLKDTLEWAYMHPGIATVGVVPLGFTRYQESFDKSFDASEDALAVIKSIEPFQKRALRERGTPWVYAADEFYRNAYLDRMLDELPDAQFYGDFSMFEDGIGIIRTMVDATRLLVDSKMVSGFVDKMKEAGMRATFLCGEAMSPYATQLADELGISDALEYRYVPNGFFGGNVSITGLLCGCDIVHAICALEDGEGMTRSLDGESEDGGTVSEDASEYERHAGSNEVLICIPSVVFNADGLTLDGLTLDDIKGQVGEEAARRIVVVDPNPLDYMDQIRRFAERLS